MPRIDKALLEAELEEANEFTHLFGLGSVENDGDPISPSITFPLTTVGGNVVSSELRVHNALAWSLGE